MESTIRILLFVIASLNAILLSAQTPKLKEWLAKKKTQREYFANQIAQLQTYLVLLQKGYSIADKGMDLIGFNSQDESNHHYSRLLSLYNTNPEINPNSVLNKARNLQQRIDMEFTRMLNFSSSSPDLSAEEKTYIGKVYFNMTIECSASITELTRIFDGYSATMSDDEKIQRIKKIAADLDDQYAFTCTFCNSSKALALARAKERNEITIMRSHL